MMRSEERTGMKKGGSPKGRTPAQLIDARIRELGDWRGRMLGRLRALVKAADPQVVEEWKWNVPVWSHDGLICTGETYKAIDFHEGATIDEAAFKRLIRAAVALNKSRARS
jgi:hypothetical protein